MHTRMSSFSQFQYKMSQSDIFSIVESGIEVYNHFVAIATNSSTGVSTCILLTK